MINIMEDVKNLTNVKVNVLNKLALCMNYAIADNVIEQIYNGEDLFEFNIGVGTLSIQMIDDCLHYDFKPSPVLENSLISAINDKKNILENQLSDSIDKHIYKTYKDML